MASKSTFILTTIALFAVSPAFATDYIVGDDAGWTLGVNYTAWADGKQFFVGDTLNFKYSTGKHDVYKVNGTDFRNCTVSSRSVALASGDDVITLAVPGRKWYICSVGKHCDMGMKLVITVAESQEGPTPAPAPAPTAGADEPRGVWSNWKLKLRF